MKRIMLIFAVISLAVVSGSTLALSQQSGSTEIAGGQGGNPFSDPQPATGTRVTAVRIRSGQTVDSVQMIYGSSAVTSQHGGSGGQENVFSLDSDEYITGISGRCGNMIDSLRIQTNKKTSPLYGGSGGDRDFQIVVPNYTEAVGFTGRAGQRLDAIGLIYAPLNQYSRVRRPGQTVGDQYSQNQVSTGPYLQTPIYGGSGGNPFANQEMPAGARVAEIRIFAGDRIDSLQMVYLLSDNSIVEGPRVGGSSGRQQIFRLDSDEYITRISGRYGALVDSLQIQTNKRTSPLYGGSGGSSAYQIDVPSGSQAVGFAGRAGTEVDAIGLTYGTQTQRYSGQYNNRYNDRYGRSQTGRSPTIRYEQTPLYGGSGGSLISDQNIPAGAQIAEIRVSVSNRIDSLQAIYILPDGSTLEGVRYGSSGGRQRVFRLDSDEYITGISGRYDTVVNSLQIQTNKRTSPVFGGGYGGGRSFQVSVPSGNQAIGFVGRASQSLDAIGLAHTRR